MKLQEFSFGNFRSFKEINTLNLAPANVKSKDERMDINNITYREKQSFLKTKAIYGANASGKSNVVRALVTFIKIIDNSVKSKSILDTVRPFCLSTETENEATFFQMIFWIEGIKYRYGFEINHNKIISEWLFGVPNIRELPYFIREEQNIIKLDKKNFKEAHKLRILLSDNDNEIFREDSLFLSTLSSFGSSKLSKKLVEAITSNTVINGLGSDRVFNEAKQSLQREHEKAYILNLLKLADIGIEEIENYEIPAKSLPEDIDDVREQLDSSKVLLSSRKKFDMDNQQIDLQPMLFQSDESEGTKKLFELSPFIYHVFRTQGVLVIDEFDARFHPLLTRQIVELFNSEKNKGAQLIFVTHDTNLLDSELLRRDQIEFVEKDTYGASHMYSLIEFKGSRKNNLFEKNYIQGKYGAIPFLGNFKEIFNDVE